MESHKKTLVTGAAGLVGQNLLLLLKENNVPGIVAIDKHPENLRLAKQFNPQLETVCADLSLAGNWEEAIRDVGTAVILHAQITAKSEQDFQRNNVVATQRLVESLKAQNVDYTVLVSSSVVNSVATDAYTRTKKLQEAVFLDSGLPGCILRPTLMFGWFDPKHLGWLARFMEKTPVFPIPGHGRYSRQPLYNRDFCRIIHHCLQTQPTNAIYNLAGDEHIDYIDIIREIRRIKQLDTVLLNLPLPVFSALLRLYSLFSRNPPFTVDQLTALTAGDEFTGVDTKALFGVNLTPVREALEETFRNPDYSGVRVERTL